MTLFVARQLARFSLSLANAWLRWRGSGLRYYRGPVDVYVNGVRMREVREIDFDHERRRR